MVTTREEAEEMAAAYRKGIQDAEGQLRQHIVAQKEQWTQVRPWTMDGSPLTTGRAGY